MIINLQTTINNEEFVNLGAYCSKIKISYTKVLDFLTMVGYIQPDNEVIDMENIKCRKQFVTGSVYNIFISLPFAEIIADTFNTKDQDMINVTAIILNWKVTQHKIKRNYEIANTK